MSNERPTLVIVIEDDAGSRSALGRLLQAGGFEAASFGSAETFISSRPNRAPLCVIVDVQLGGMSGLDLQERLHGEGSKVPIIVITGNRAEGIRERALRAGCAAFLLKPFCPDALLTLLQSMASSSPC
jgi:FixJ family two-component response regulator